MWLKNNKVQFGLTHLDLQERSHPLWEFHMKTNHESLFESSLVAGFKPI